MMARDSDTEEATLSRISTPGRGRSRDPQVTEAILKAAAELTDRYGFTGVTIDAIAAKAGVARATIYRRWPDKTALTMEAFLASVNSTLTWADTGSIREDARHQLVTVAVLLGEDPAGQRIARLIGDAQADSALGHAFRERFLGPRRAECRLAFERAVTRGQLRDDIDLELATDALYGPLYYRLLVGHQPLTREFAEDLFDRVFPTFECRDLGERCDG